VQSCLRLGGRTLTLSQCGSNACNAPLLSLHHIVPPMDTLCRPAVPGALVHRTVVSCSNKVHCRTLCSARQDTRPRNITCPTAPTWAPSTRLPAVRQMRHGPWCTRLHRVPRQAWRQTSLARDGTGSPARNAQGRPRHGTSAARRRPPRAAPKPHPAVGHGEHGRARARRQAGRVAVAHAAAREVQHGALTRASPGCSSARQSTPRRRRAA